MIKRKREDNTTTTMIQFKQIINNIVIRKRVFDHVKRINRQLKEKYNECYKWVDIYSSFNLLVQFGYLNELKYRLENEGIDDYLYKLYNSDKDNNEKKDNNKIDKDKEGEEIDHRIIGLGRTACMYGHLKIVEYLNQHHQSRYAFNRRDMFCATKYGHQEIAEYLFDNRSEGYDQESIIVAAEKGYNQLLDKMLERWNRDDPKAIRIAFKDIPSIDTLRIIHKHKKNDITKGAIVDSIKRNDLEMFKFINEHYPHLITKDNLRFMSIEYLDIFKYLVENRSDIKGSKECIEYASRTGQLELLKELVKEYPNQLDHPDLMKSQHIPILEYLNKEHGLEPKCSQEAANGNLELIKYYHQNGVDLNGLIDEASRNGQLDIVKYLHYNVPDIECTPLTMDLAASLEYLDVAEFLHQHRTEGCTIDTMTNAINNNQLKVVKFLHQHRTEGYNPESIYSISLEMLEFLHLNRTEQLNSHPLIRAIEDYDLDIIKYIHYNLPHITFDIAEEYSGNSLEIVEFLTTNRKDFNIDFPSISNEILKYYIDNHIDMIPDDIMYIFYTSYLGNYDVERVHLICRILKLKGIEPRDYHWTGLQSLESIEYLRLFTQYQLSPDRLFDNACRSLNLAVIDYLLSCYPSIKIESYHFMKRTKSNAAFQTYLNNLYDQQQDNK